LPFKGVIASVYNTNVITTIILNSLRFFEI